jgi:hypothetical protein
MAFTSIAKDILRDAEILDAFIRDNNLPEPSLDASGPLRTPWSGPQVVEAQSNLLASTHRLHHLTEGPASAWMGGLNGPGGDLLTNTAIVHFDIASYVPLDGTASFADVAAKCGMALRDFKMIVRYAMTNFIFCEPEVEVIAHTASSKALVQNKLLASMSKMGCDEIVPALGKVMTVEHGHVEQTMTGSAGNRGVRKVSRFRRAVGKCELKYTMTNAYEIRLTRSLGLVPGEQRKGTHVRIPECSSTPESRHRSIRHGNARLPIAALRHAQRLQLVLRPQRHYRRCWRRKRSRMSSSRPRIPPYEVHCARP